MTVEVVQSALPFTSIHWAYIIKAIQKYLGIYSTDDGQLFVISQYCVCKVLLASVRAE